MPYDQAGRLVGNDSITNVSGCRGASTNVAGYGREKGECGPNASE